MEMAWGGNPFEKEKKMSLYIHIPFCNSKCTYCNFISFANIDKQIPKYLDALYEEIDERGKEYRDYKITTVYIGGGTPSILPDGEIDELMQFIRSRFTVLYDESVTIEANPKSLTKEKAKEYFNAGINRISLGLQTDNPSLLKLLNRPHNYEDFEKAVEYAKSAGFSDFNADILLGIPNQTLRDVKITLDKLVKLPITHISAYGLILEKGTPISKSVETGKLKICNEDLANKMYDYTVKRLLEAGFYRYEISNFAKESYASKHNLNYWNRGEYLGLGLASHSFVNGEHWHNTENLPKYLKNPTDCKEDIEQQTLETAKQETIMLSLRTEAGLDIREFNREFNANFMQDYLPQIKKLLEANLITIKDFFVTINDFNVSNAIIEEFF